MTSSRSGVGMARARRTAPWAVSGSLGAGNVDLVEAGQAGLQAAQRLLQASA
jgi:hypothetical protein